MKNLKRKNHAIIVLFVLLIAIAVGYAAFQSVLTINGSVSTTANWDVKFTSASLLNSSGTAAGNAYGSASIDANNDKVVNATVTLAYPGDAVKLQTVITNNGNLDAKLTSVNVDTSQLGNEITITPTAVGNAGLPTANEILAAGASCTCEFVIQWKPNSTAASASGSFTVTFTYDQDAQAISITPAHSHSNPSPSP